MKAINYLRQIKILDAKIENSIEELNSLEALATKTNCAIGENKVKSSGSQEKMADCVIKITELKDKINKDVSEFVDYKQEANELICNSCDADCCRLLYLRYFSYYTWEAIAVEMRFSYQWVSGKLHARALSQLQGALDKIS